MKFLGDNPTSKASKSYTPDIMDNEDDIDLSDVRKFPRKTD